MHGISFVSTTPGALIMNDALGRPREVPWPTIAAVGVGVDLWTDTRENPYAPMSQLAERMPPRNGIRGEYTNPFIDVAIREPRSVRVRWSLWRSVTPGLKGWFPRAEAALQGLHAHDVPFTEAAQGALGGDWPETIVDGWVDRAVGWLLWRRFGEGARE